MEPVSRRWWGLDARQTAVLFAAALVIGILIAVALGRTGGDGGPDRSTTGPAPAVARVRPGERGAAGAVWVFGFETLRFDPGLRRTGQVALQGYGDVLGVPGSVLLFDAGTGRLGRLDARHNELATLATLAPGSNADTPFVPTLAASATGLWVAPDPGRVVRVDPVSGAVGPGVPVAGDTATATGLAGDGTRVYAASATPDGLEVVRVGDDGAVAVSGIVPGATLDGVAVDATAVWIRAGSRLLALDPDTLAVTRTREVPSRGGIAGLVVADGSVWMLDDGGASLLRFDPARDRFRRVARLLDRHPAAVELPAALVTDGRRVAAMVQRSGGDDLTARVVVHEPRRGRTHGVDVPGRIAPGALALSTR